MDLFSDVIWVIDDHQLFSAGLQQMLLNSTNCDAVHCFSHPNQAIELFDQRPALIVMDFYIPDVEPLVWIKAFVEMYPTTPVIVISSSISPADKHQSMRAGASAYYPKHTSPPLMMDEINHWLEKGKFKPEPDLDLIVAKHQLTIRQIDILIQMARGGSNKKIADLLDISSETVKSHISSIYLKIGCETRDQAIEWARKKGFI